MSPFPFLRLPLELREQVYSLYFRPADRIRPDEGEYGGGQYKFDFDIYGVNKQVKAEAEDVFRRENVFVRIETPWPQVVYHISEQGLMPIVAAGDRSLRFKHAHGIVRISAPIHGAGPTHTIVLLLDNLPAFCQVWYYHALNHPELNEHLGLTLILQDPYYPADPKPTPIALQKRLLLPFGDVKGLYELDIQGYDDGVKQELERLMAVPYDSVQKCLEDCASLMEEGDRELGVGHAEEALELYVKAFHAIHINISGRVRHVSADNFFHQPIESGRYSGQTGTTVRILLRINLVSRTVSAYLKLAQYEEAAFWGMRSITIMREAMETAFDDFLEGFVGASDVGVLYIRTAIAFKKMEDSGSEELKVYKDDDVANSEQLFTLAGKILKGSHQSLAEKELKEHDTKAPDGVFEKENASDVDLIRC